MIPTHQGCPPPAAEHRSTHGQHHESEHARRVIGGRRRDPVGPEDGHLLRRPFAIRTTWRSACIRAPAQLDHARFAAGDVHARAQTMRTVTPGTLPPRSPPESCDGDSTVSARARPAAAIPKNHDPDGHDPRTPRRPHDAVTITSAPGTLYVARVTHEGRRDAARQTLDLLARRRSAPTAVSLAGNSRRCPRALSAARRADRCWSSAPAPASCAGWLPQASFARARSTASRRARRPTPCTGVAPTPTSSRAAAEALPIAAGVCGGGRRPVRVRRGRRCVKATVAEIARVLAPGGRFVHLLDMATLLEQPFEKLAGSGLVPIPNVFGDPAITSGRSTSCCCGATGWRTCGFAAARRHPFAATFAPIFAPFLADRVRRRRRDQRVQGDRGQRRRRRTLAALLTSASACRSRRATRPSTPALSLRPLPAEPARDQLR